MCIYNVYIYIYMYNVCVYIYIYFASFSVKPPKEHVTICFVVWPDNKQGKGRKAQDIYTYIYILNTK